VHRSQEAESAAVKAIKATARPSLTERCFENAVTALRDLDKAFIAARENFSNN